MSYHSRADYSKVLPMFVLIKMNKWLRVCREWKRKDIKGKFICVPLLVRNNESWNRQSANGMKQLCDLLRRENSDRIFHLWPCWLQRGNRHWLRAVEIRDQEKNKVQNSEYESQIVAWFFLLGDKMQRKAQPFQGSLQIEERTLLVSGVAEGYSLDQSQGQMQEDYAKPESVEGIIELLLHAHGSNPAICNLFLLFFFLAEIDSQIQFLKNWPQLFLFLSYSKGKP